MCTGYGGPDILFGDQLELSTLNGTIGMAFNGAASHGRPLCVVFVFDVADVVVIVVVVFAVSVESKSLRHRCCSGSR